jgi:hypothetical protein
LAEAQSAHGSAIQKTVEKHNSTELAERSKPER